MPIIIGDMGSNHLGDLGRAKEMVQAFAEAGGTIFKGQLFKPEQYPHNIAIPEVWIDPLREETEKAGVGLLFSVFYPHEWNLGAVKIAYSQRHNFSLIKHFQDKGMRLIVSGDKDTWWPRDCVKLLCVPKYPAIEEDYRKASGVCWDNLDKEYDGLSWHCVGVEKPIEIKPKWIEIHFKLGDAKEKKLSPDAGDFAVTPDELRELCQAMKG